jgi:hypothetical protein
VSMIWASTRRFGVSNGIRSRRRAAKVPVAELLVRTAELLVRTAELLVGTADCSFVLVFDLAFSCAAAPVADRRAVFGFVRVSEPFPGSGVFFERATLAIRTPLRIGGVQLHSNTRAEQSFPCAGPRGWVFDDDVDGFHDRPRAECWVPLRGMPRARPSPPFCWMLAQADEGSR